MGGPALLRCLLWTALYAASSAQSPQFLITAPRLLHLGLGEDVWLQMEWPGGSSAPNEIKMEMYLRNQLNYKDCSKHHPVTLRSGNSYIAKQTIELSPEMASACQLGERRGQQYVQLVASSVVFGSALKVVSIPVSYKRGYIFIQTDKSIYTPKESVNIRVFTLDHVMRPTEEQIVCTVTNPQGLQVMKIQRLAVHSVVNYKLPIPDISTPGVWKISAYFTTATESNFTAEFEVRKYVLPNFEVKIVPEHPYFLITNEEFVIKVEARYVYGESVDGVAYIRLGIINQKGERTILQGLEQQVKLEDGEGTVRITKDSVVKKINQPAENLLESTLYIAASVMEKASGTLEEKELTSVKFVSSPYRLDLSKTRKYFTPGFSTTVVAEVTYNDGSLASGVMVSILRNNVELISFMTDNNGVASTVINTDGSDRSLELTIRAGGKDDRQEEKINLIPYSSKTRSFLHLEIAHQVLNPGESLRVTMKVHCPNPESVKKIYYMVISKGQTLSLQFVPRSELVVLTVPVTARMVPSFRIIAYYYINAEIVANSVWVDVTDVCEGKLEITTDLKDTLKPGDPFKLILETDDTTSVALSAVDTAVYLLNSKNKLTPSKMFKAMNEYDLGCSAGGGKDFKSVFTDAGLAFVSSAGYSDFQELGCKVSQRKKRSIDFLALTKQKVNNYTSPELKRCCSNGMALLPPRMERDCEKRARRINDDACRNVFHDCCKFAEKLRKQIASNRKRHSIGRTLVNEDEEDFVDEGEVQSRSFFPESWMWRTVTVNKKLSITEHLPDSITTWEIQAVGMSKGKGFCVAAPVKVKVFKEFHLHLRVPYSVKRFEQIELRPVLYNYYDKEMKVKVLMEKTDGICSPVTAEDSPVERIITMAPGSAVSVPFAIVPIGKTSPIVTVKALGPLGISDVVKKTLRIEREGVAVVEEKIFTINPKEKGRNEITVDEELPSNIIPDGDFRTSVKMSVDSPMNTINNSLSHDGVSRLIRVPYGCAEQTMISTAPGVYALRYLDHTEKWTVLPPDRRDQAYENMRNGYLRILQYRKPEGSYGAWLHRPSSTWLTAFVVKVMSLCRIYVDVDVEEIRKSAAYLTSKQIGSGAFQETTPVIHQDMMGGVQGSNAGVSLTAYVLVALHHSKGALAEDDITVKSSISRAIDYLRVTLDSVSDTYALTITAYALTLTSSDSVLKDKAYTKLLSAAQFGPNQREMYFGTKGTALAIETTAYALLSALLRKDLPNAEKMYTWLSEQRNYGGGFKSTQDTVMALEALSEYWIDTFTNNKVELHVNVISLEKSGKQTFTLRSDQSLQEDLRSMGTKFKVEVSGEGKGVLTVLKMYNIMQVEKSSCSQLGLEVKVHGDDGGKGEPDDSYDYDYEDEQMSDEPRDNIYWHDQRTRVRREASQPKQKDVTVIYEVCLWKKLQSGSSGMAIVDITLLSGFEPNAQDLNKLKDGPEMYISHYEIQAGRLLLYFDKVSNNQDCVTFEAIQQVRISPLQPTSAVLYDFYEPENQCRVFYGAPSTSAFISTLCSGDVCQCAEGPCPVAKQTLKLKKTNRQEFACYSPRVTYGFRVNVADIKQEGSFIVYTAEIAEVLQKNADEDIKKGETRFFYQRAACKMRLMTKEYLIMGQDGETTDESGRMRYFLENNSWIEELPSDQTCKATRNRNTCASVRDFMDSYRNNGCMV